MAITEAISFFEAKQSLFSMCSVIFALELALNMNILLPSIIVGFIALIGWKRDTKIFCPGNNSYNINFLEELKQKVGLTSSDFLVKLSMMLQTP